MFTTLVVEEEEPEAAAAFLMIRCIEAALAAKAVSVSIDMRDDWTLPRRSDVVWLQRVECDRDDRCDQERTHRPVEPSQA